MHKHTYQTPSRSAHVRVKYVRCVLEVSDNLSETHAVLFSCAAVLWLIYSSAPLCPLSSLSALLPKRAVIPLSSSIIPPSCAFSPSLSLSVGLQGLHGISITVLLFSPRVQILNGSTTQVSVVFFPLVTQTSKHYATLTRSLAFSSSLSQSKSFFSSMPVFL